MIELERIEELFDVRPDQPGCVVGVAVDGEVVHLEAHGMANLDHGVPLTPDSVLYIASTSKQFTAACLQLLAMDGALSLDDDVRAHLPDQPDHGTPITLRHLLHHTSGHRDWLGLVSLRGGTPEDVLTQNTALELIARQSRLNFAPGARFSYSNSGYVLIASVVEAVCARSITDFANERIFGPLGMTATTFRQSRGRPIPGLATGYAVSEAGGLRAATVNLEAVGGGGIVSTVPDLLRWDTNFRKPVVGGSDFLERMAVRGVLNDGTPLAYASGLMFDEYRGVPRRLHGGGYVGFSAELVSLPDQRITVCVLSNSPAMNAPERATAILDLFLDDITGSTTGAGSPSAPTPDDDPTSDLAPALGTWVNSDVGLVITLESDEKDGTTIVLGGARLPCRGGPRDFRFGASASLVLDEAGTTATLTLGTVGEAVVLTRVADHQPTLDELAAFTGRYACTDLDTTYEFRVESEALHVRIAGQSIPMAAAGADVFAIPAGTIRFERDDDERVSGATVSTPRAAGFDFVRRQ